MFWFFSLLQSQNISTFLKSCLRWTFEFSSENAQSENAQSENAQSENAQSENAQSVCCTEKEVEITMEKNNNNLSTCF